MMALSCAPNLRDVGGAIGFEGRRVRSGRLFRCEALLEPTPEDAAALDDHGIGLVCDLRGEAERRHAPNRWWAAQGVRRAEFDLLAGFSQSAGPWSALKQDPGRAGGVAAMRTVYAGMPAAAASHLAPLIDAMLAEDRAVLIHCTAGKDRTGFVSALLLAILGVERSGIMADYLASRGRRTERVVEATRRLVQAQVGAVSLDALEALLDVEEAYLDTSFDVIAEQYGDLAGYLRFTGVGPDRIATLRTRLLA